MANLSGADLSRADLSRANLSGADLAWANLSKADLREADLSGADLARANLSGADLAWANLSKANLSGADLVWADLGEIRVVQFGPTGSRRDYLVFKFGPSLDEVMTGCFTGTLAEFKAAVTSTHGDNRYGLEYQAIIAMLEALRQ